MLTPQAGDRTCMPPRRRPVYGEPLLGDEAILEPAEALRLFCHQLAAQIEIRRDAVFAGETYHCRQMVLNDHGLEAQFIRAGSAHSVTLHAGLVDAWICITATYKDRGCHFFVERVYEDWEVWPEGSAGLDEAPGGIRKRMHVAQAEAKAWPALAHLAANGLLTIELKD